MSYQMQSKVRINTALLRSFIKIIDPFALNNVVSNLSKRKVSVRVSKEYDLVAWEYPAEIVVPSSGLFLLFASLAVHLWWYRYK